VEDFFQRPHGAIWQGSVGPHEKVSHLTLPSLIHFTLGHARTRQFKIFGFQISN
jgi:hypothetical protein